MKSTERKVGGSHVILTHLVYISHEENQSGNRMQFMWRSFRQSENSADFMTRPHCVNGVTDKASTWLLIKKKAEKMEKKSNNC